MLKIFIYLAALFAATTANCQNTFSGYYITLKGDTVQGAFPKYKEWTLNPGTVSFIDKYNKTTDLTPLNVRGFAIAGYDSYLSKRVIRTTNPTEFIPGFNEMETADMKEPLEAFMQVIYNKNNIRLFEFKDRKRVNYFIQYNTDTLAELQFKTYVANSIIVEERKYKEQLRSMFYSKIIADKNLQNKLDRLAYENESLVRFLDKMLDTKTSIAKTKYPSDLSLLAGVSANSFAVNGSNDITPALATYKTSFGPVVGVAYNTYSKRNFGKNVLSILLKYYSFNNVGLYAAAYPARQYEYIFKAKVLSLGFAISRRWVNKPSLSWYTSFIPAFNVLMGNNSLVKNEGRTTNFGSQEGQDIFGNFSVKTGFVFRKKFGIWASYNIGAVNTQNFIQFTTEHRALQFGVDYKL